MHKLTFIFLIVLSFSSIIIGQSVLFRTSIYHSSFNMDQIKEYQTKFTEEYGSSLEIPIKEVDKFPSNNSYQLSLGLRTSYNFGYGIFFNYSSTAGRSDYRDYSGNIRTDLKISTKDIGIYLEYLYPLLKYINIGVGGKFLMEASQLNYESKLVIFSNESNSSQLYNSKSFAVNPYLFIETNYDIFLFRFNMGYLLDFQGELENSKNKNVGLFITSSKVGLDWSGTRLGLDIGLRI